MRFISNGPSIPDELLVARDQGRVIFFCGAGVSFAKAGLPNFFQLAQKVIDLLGTANNSLARQLYDFLDKGLQDKDGNHIELPSYASTLISTDRIFSLLEQEFETSLIEKTVAQVLKPSDNADLSAHELLLNLATTPEGRVQLVTTNFDRLFDDCSTATIPCYLPPNLPDLSKNELIDGLVYLHGKANSDYTGVEGYGFVLSGSEFGKAYLSDGWATSFIREIFSKYTVVFIGYSANDPPVQYLLEGLNKDMLRTRDVYAFQSGSIEEARKQWEHKGVQAIAYNPENKHEVLWKTLDAWAKRAQDTDQWYSRIIALAQRGPTKLLPHERGQVAHIVSTVEGMKKFALTDSPPPAEWLCVFDPNRRFAKPGNLDLFGEKGQYIDPFDLYGLDSDTPPANLDPENFYAKREVPSDAWNAFVPNKFDRFSSLNENPSSFREYLSFYPPGLIPRIDQLGMWIAKVCDQPATVWWVAHQNPLHENIQKGIIWYLNSAEPNVQPQIRKAWQFLFEAWKESKNNSYDDKYDLEAIIEKEGWSNALVRKCGELCRPHFFAEPARGSPIPPITSAKLGIWHLIHRKVKYSELPREISIPDNWCSAVLKVFRQNLELALHLEMEIGGYGLRFGPIIADKESGNDTYSRKHGLSGMVFQLTSAFSKLVDIDIHAAREEFLAWPTNDEIIFARLRIWAAGKKEIVSARDFKHVISKLSDTAFWDPYHQRDLLFVLASRWSELSIAARKSIERRLTAGPKQWKQEKMADFKKRKAWAILERIHWLANSGCTFLFNFEKVTNPLYKDVPNWKPEYEAKAVEPLEPRGGWVKTETSHEALLNISLTSILSRASELSGSKDDFLVEKDPFAGLAAKHPQRAFSALTNAAKRGGFPRWAWERFLYSDARKNDKAKLVWLIAERLASYPEAQLVTLIGPVSEWFRNVSATLADNYVASFGKITQKLINVLRAQPNQGHSNIIRDGKEPNWVLEAINSPPGRIAQAMFNDFRSHGLKVGQGFPLLWLEHIEALLTLSDDLRRYVLVILFHNLNWFYSIDQTWTEKNLLSIFDSNKVHDHEAAWSGFLWGAKKLSRELCLRLKKRMLALATSLPPSCHSYVSIIASILLSGWGSSDEAGERCISNDEMHTLLLKADSEFRSQVLLQAKCWLNENGENEYKGWADLLPELLRIWPRQISAKSPSVSARLCELAFSNVELFPLIAELILPLLTKIEQNGLMLSQLLEPNNNVIDQHPVQTLEILYAVLPANALVWPYNTGEILRRIGEADKTLNTDKRLITLKRRWDLR